MRVVKYFLKVARNIINRQGEDDNEWQGTTPQPKLDTYTAEGFF